MTNFTDVAAESCAAAGEAVAMNAPRASAPRRRPRKSNMNWTAERGEREAYARPILMDRHRHSRGAGDNSRVPTRSGSNRAIPSEGAKRRGEEPRLHVL